MIQIAASVLVIAAILLSTELLWRNKTLKRESGRKIIHIAIGAWVACWPLFLPFVDIQLIGFGMFIVVAVSRQLKLFRSIHTVQRTTVGEIFFPLAIVFCAMLTQTPWIFAVAMIHLGVADGLASVVGGRSKRTTFHILGQRKSISGCAAFAGVSLAALSVAVITQHAPASALLIVPIATTFIEVISPFGLDDLTVPLATVWLLTVL